MAKIKLDIYRMNIDDEIAYLGPIVTKMTGNAPFTTLATKTTALGTRRHRLRAANADYLAALQTADQKRTLLANARTTAENGRPRPGGRRRRPHPRRAPPSKAAAGNCSPTATRPSAHCPNRPTWPPPAATSTAPWTSPGTPTDAASKPTSPSKPRSPADPGPNATSASLPAAPSPA